jgi:2,3-bisphosphoglycerate-dependent phosphoglycerate mutase
MKKTIFLLILSIWSYACSTAVPSSTTIYIVRHAEKDLSDPKNQDPDLNVDGKLRVLALNEKLKNEKIDAVFSSKFKRTIKTGLDIAKSNKLVVQEYDAHNYKELSDLVKTKFKHKKVLIIGHSNTVLELVESFGVTRPLGALTDDDYDFFFEVKIDHMGKVALSTSQYGKPHRNSIIK